jgi:hypothetical protein
MTTTVTPPLGLTINQRNIYMYFLNHRKKYKNTLCYVPRCPGQNSRLEQWLNALVKLEMYGLIRVDRSSANYTGWIILEPKTT